MDFKSLKHKDRNRAAMTQHELLYLNMTQEIIGYEVALHLPLGGKFVLGADDAEKIVKCIWHLIP